MDLFGIVIRAMAEGLTQFINAMINSLTMMLYEASDVAASTTVLKYITPLEQYTTGIAYTLLATFVLISILKQLVQEDDISFATILVRVTITAITISTVPILMIYLYDKSNVIVKEMLELISIEKPNIDSIDYLALIRNIANGTVPIVFTSFATTFLIFVLISLISIFVLYIQSVFYQVILLIMRIVAPIVSLGVLNYNFDLLTIFLKDVISIYITRILQLVLLKVGFSLIMGSVIEVIKLLVSGSDITLLMVEKSNGMIVGCTFILILIFMPMMLKKYTAVSGAGNAIKSMVKVSSQASSQLTGGGQ